MALRTHNGGRYRGMENEREGQLTLDLGAGIPESALDFVTSPRIRCKQNAFERRRHGNEAEERQEELRFGADCSCCSHSKMDTISRTADCQVRALAPSSRCESMCSGPPSPPHTPTYDPLLSVFVSFGLFPVHTRRLWVGKKSRSAVAAVFYTFLCSTRGSLGSSICCHLFTQSSAFSLFPSPGCC